MAVQIYYGEVLFEAITDRIGARTPVPTVSVSNTANKSVDGDILGITNSITIDGIVLGQGITDCTAAYNAVESFFTDPKKQGKTFKIVCDQITLIEYPGAQFVSINGEKSNNNWAVTIPYTVTLESYSGDTTGGLIQSFEDSWTIEPLEDTSYYSIDPSDTSVNLYSKTDPRISEWSIRSLQSTAQPFGISNYLQYRIVHKISAVGRSTGYGSALNPVAGPGITTDNYKTQAYAEAAKWVKQRANFATTPGIILSEGLNLFNHIRSIESNVSAGSYAITDTWLALGVDKTYTEEFTWEISTDSKRLKTVTLQGTIKGLESSDPYTIFPSALMTGNISNNFPGNFGNQTKTNNKYISALNVYTSDIKPNLYARASYALYATNSGLNNQSYFDKGSYLLNTVPLSYTETLNPNAGTIGYNVVYDTRPGPWLSGAITATLTITDNHAADQVAEVFVLGRPLGPVLEAVGKTATTRNLNLDVVYDMPRTFGEAHPNSNISTLNNKKVELQNLVDSFKPNAAVAFKTLEPTSAWSITYKGQVFTRKNNQVWNPMEGRLTWDIEWLYSSGCQ